MPKALTAAERERIDKALLAAAGECMRTLGIRRTTIDELVRRANIPKGTFYLFYQAKELLFAHVLFNYHHEVEAELISGLRALPAVDADGFTDVVCAMFEKVAESFFPTLIMNGELEQLMRKLPEQMVLDHHKDDDSMLLHISAFLPDCAVKRLPCMSAAFRLLFMSVLYKREIGEAEFGATIRLLIYGLALQLFDESEEQK